ncbi:molybdopterin-dependent oxidoreductase [Microbacterium hominis]|uniref:Molybdopterin-dependent oxidoreductase n=1 Tax=Microbacterium hominis TaxID=162426 RepID=A0A7D4Q2G1_9MICO|nr:molybdopterin-dependent oxidoreductase [Microbacterium hominis]QKJ19411.1 molybdopterin-dependent oxidoreductase [Microbacterium hominis]
MAGFTARLGDRFEGVADGLRARSSTPGRRTRTTVVLGRVLAVLLLVCFATGLYSHVLQTPPSWLTLSPDPAWLYRVTQGTHVAAGIALVPVLLGKLWSVFPRLFAWPPITGLGSLLERATIALLVATVLLEVVLGLMNVAQWYAFPFSFRRVHLALAWVLIGATLLHVAVKLPVIAGFWRRSPRRAQGAEASPAPARAPAATWPEQSPPDPSRPTAPEETLSRRGALLAVGAAAGALTLATVGQSFTPLGPLAVLAPRRPGIGPQGLPVNRTAAEAEVSATDASADWRLSLVGRQRTLELSRRQLETLPQAEIALPIACVEGWSQQAQWGGVRLRDLLRLIDEQDGPDLTLSSMQTRGAFSVTAMPGVYARHPDTLIALRLGGEPLHLDHGYPARVIAPGRPGVMQTKWLRRIEVDT